MPNLKSVGLASVLLVAGCTRSEPPAPAGDHAPVTPVTPVTPAIQAPPSTPPSKSPSAAPGADVVPSASAAPPAGTPSAPTALVKVEVDGAAVSVAELLAGEYVAAYPPAQQPTFMITFVLGPESPTSRRSLVVAFDPAAAPGARACDSPTFVEYGEEAIGADGFPTSSKYWDVDVGGSCQVKLDKIGAPGEMIEGHLEATLLSDDHPPAPRTFSADFHVKRETTPSAP